MIPNGSETDFEMVRNRSDSSGLNSNLKLSDSTTDPAYITHYIILCRSFR